MATDLSYRIISAAIEVHRTLGPGLLESTYRACLVRELQLNAMTVQIERPIPLNYKGVTISEGYRADLLVERQILVELKAVQALLPIHKAQLLTYMRLCDVEVGLLLNFNAQTLRQGLRRLILRPLT